MSLYAFREGYMKRKAPREDQLLQRSV